MPSFDIVNKIDWGELKNALNQTQRMIQGRYDFKGSHMILELKDDFIELVGPDEVKVKTALDILMTTMAKRGLSVKSLEIEDAKPSGNRQIQQRVGLKQGIDKEQGKLIHKIVKNSGLKLTSAYMDEKVRITGKKRDHLQQVWSLIKEDKEIKTALQMENLKS